MTKGLKVPVRADTRESRAPDALFAGPCLAFLPLGLHLLSYGKHFLHANAAFLDGDTPADVAFQRQPIGTHSYASEAIMYIAEDQPAGVDFTDRKAVCEGIVVMGSRSSGGRRWRSSWRHLPHVWAGGAVLAAVPLSTLDGDVARPRSFRAWTRSRLCTPSTWR